MKLTTRELEFTEKEQLAFEELVRQTTEKIIDKTFNNRIDELREFHAQLDRHTQTVIKELVQSREDFETAMKGLMVQQR